MRLIFTLWTLVFSLWSIIHTLRSSQKTFLWQVGDDQDVTVMMPMLRTMLNMKAPLFVFKSLDELETDLWRQVDLMNTTTIKSSKCPYGQLGSKLAILSCKMTKNIAPPAVALRGNKNQLYKQSKKMPRLHFNFKFWLLFWTYKSESWEQLWWWVGGQLGFSDPH